MTETRRETQGGNSRKILWASGAFVALLFVGAVAVATLPSPVEAFGRHGGSGHMHDYLRWRAERVLNELDATEEQKARIEQIVETRMESLHALRGDHESERGEVVALLTADSVDRAAMEAMRAEHLGRIETASKQLVEGAAEIAEVLTPEQRAELAGMLEKHEGRHGRHGRHHDRRGWRH